MTWLLLRRDTDTAPWSYLGAFDQRPDPTDTGLYKILDLETAGEDVAVSDHDAAAIGLRRAADRWRQVRADLPPLDDQSAGQVETAVTEVAVEVAVESVITEVAPQP